MLRRGYPPRSSAIRDQGFLQPVRKREPESIVRVVPERDVDAVPVPTFALAPPM